MPAVCRDGMWCSTPGKGGGGGGAVPCLPRLGGSARGLGCVAGAGDLGRPDGQRCAESQLLGGRGCRGCQLLSAPGDAGARRPRAGPIYSGEPGGCRYGPAPGAGGAAGPGRGGCWHFLGRGPSVPLRLCSCCPGSRSCLGVGRTRPLAALCPPQELGVPPTHSPAGCPVVPAAPMAGTGPVRLRACGLCLGWHGARHGFCVPRPVPCAVPEVRGGGPHSSCTSVVMPWDPPTPGDGHWPGDMALAPAAWHDGLQGSPCPMLSLPTGHRDRPMSVGHCAPWGGEVALPVPKLRVARAGTALNEPLASPLGEGGVLGVSGPGKGGGLCAMSPTPLTASPSLPWPTDRSGYETPTKAAKTSLKKSCPEQGPHPPPPLHR